MKIAIFIKYCHPILQKISFLNIVINIKKIPNESDKGVVVLLSDPETDQYIQEVSHFIL